MQQKVPNQGNTWDYFTVKIKSFFDRVDREKIALELMSDLPLNKPTTIEFLPPAMVSFIGQDFLESISMLGKRTAQMHIAISSDKNNHAFSPQLFNEDYSVWLKNRLMLQFDIRYNLVEQNLQNGECLNPADSVRKCVNS